MEKSLLSILVPLYNEEQFVGTLLDKVLAIELPAGLRREIIVVDDCSTDASPAIVEAMAAIHPEIRLIRSEQNQGKGGAIHTAIAHARGEYSIIQDADLEYDPADYPKLLNPLLDNRADAVFGSRFLSSSERRVLYFWHSLANQLLTLGCNLVSDLNLTDMETCYKVVRTPLLQSIPLRNKRFGFEPELTIKLAKRKARIYEVPISYNGRTYEEGKKIGLKDAFEAFYTVARYAFTHDLYLDNDKQILHAFSQARNFNRWMADTIRPFIGKDTLEIGAGMGNLSKQLAKKCRRYVATDYDYEHLARLNTELAHRPNIETAVADLESPPDFEPFREQMDTVICLNVLEHVERDRVGLANLHSVLRPGGRAVVLVPEGQNIYGTLDRILGHYRRYSAAELRQKMEEAGFTVERILDFNRISRPGWFVTGKLLKRDNIRPFQLKMFDRLVWLWRKIDAGLPWGPTSIIAIGVKPAAVASEAPEVTSPAGIGNSR